MKKKIKRKHDCDWQLLSYGHSISHIGTTTNIMVVIICRKCTTVIERTINKKELRSYIV